MKKLAKQQLRWARGSQYNTLRMLPWMLGHAPVLAFFFVMDIVLPFLLAGVIGGWVWRAISGQGYNFYQGFLREYGVQSGVLMVLGLMVVSSVLSMAIRQMRHLSEKPSDFFRLPIFIIVSTAFLMPIRILGFFRMGHASGWGTRAGAYAGGAANDDLIDGLAEHPEALVAASTAEHDADEAVLESLGFEATELEHHGQTAVAVSPRRAARDRVAAPAPAPPRRLNPQAAWPYVIGFTVLALQGAIIV